MTIRNHNESTPAPVQQCRACGADIVWLRSVSENGKYHHIAVEIAGVEASDQLYDSEKHEAHWFACPRGMPMGDKEIACSPHDTADALERVYELLALAGALKETREDVTVDLQGLGSLVYRLTAPSLAILHELNTWQNDGL